jgi:hypothetical protein
VNDSDSWAHEAMVVIFIALAMWFLYVFKDPINEMRVELHNEYMGWIR